MLLLVAGCRTVDIPQPKPIPDKPLYETIRRLTSILDYVAGDYQNAIKNGSVANKLEYQEQIDFVATASSLLKALPKVENTPSLTQKLRILHQKIENKVASSEVEQLARTLRQNFLEAYPVIIAPKTVPSIERRFYSI